eukprot:Sspe_Gene.44105::Locus_21607_Transcript_1_1_Confidence_1.000_Length_3041::g.44105::m.44105
MAVSVRGLLIALSFLSILITAILCSYMAIQSGDAAIDDTQKSGERSLTTVQEAVGATISLRTGEYLDEVTSGAVRSIFAFLDRHRFLSRSRLRMMESYGASSTQWSTVYGMRTQMWSDQVSFMEGGLTGSGIITYDGKAFFLYEDADTIENPLDGWHHVLTMKNSEGNKNSVFGTAIPYDGAQYDMPGGEDYGMIEKGNCSNLAAATNGTKPNYPCRLVWNPQSAGFYQVGMLAIQPGVEHIKYTHMVPVGGDSLNKGSPGFVGLFAVGTWAAPSIPKAGVSWIGIDLRHVSLILRRALIPDVKQRIFTCTKEDWLYKINPVDSPDPAATFNQKHWLSGTSHGSPFYEYNYYTLLPRPATNATDPLIQEVAQYIADQPEQYDTPTFSSKGFLHLVTLRDGKYFLRVTTLETDFGVSWYVVVVLDRDYVLGAVDQALANTKAAIDADNDKVGKDLEEARMILYIVLTVVSIGLVVLTGVIVVRIVAPIRVLKEEMSLVAVMKLEQVNEERPLSALSEVASMQKSFLKMIKNLREYRNYMPASVLQSSSDEESESSAQEESKVSSSRRRSSSGMGHNPAVVSPAETHLSAGTGGQNRRHYMIGRNGSFGQRIGGGANTELKIRKMSFLVLNCVGFHHMVNNLDLKSMLTAHSKILARILTAVKETKGIPEGFNGDRVAANWNGAKPNPCHRFHAVRCSSTIKTAFKELEPVSLMGGDCWVPIPSIAVTFGEVTCGNMGCDTMKKYTTIGTVVPWVYALERLNRIYNTTILIDEALALEIGPEFFTRVVDKVSYTKLRSAPILISEVLHAKTAENMEWMYQLEVTENNDPNGEFNRIMREILTGSLTKATSLVNEGADSLSEDDLIILRKLIQETQQAGLANPLPRSEVQLSMM